MRKFGHESYPHKAIMVDCWLIVERGDGGGSPRVRVTAGYPNLGRKERAINIKLKLPFALFDTPTLTANIEVDAPDQAVSIDANAIAAAVRGAVGMDVDIVVAHPDQGDAA